ncbi:MAG: signal peptidase I [Syntrophobacteraceae bacterium]
MEAPEAKTVEHRTIKILGSIFLSLLMPGLGHLSCGKNKRGLFFYLLAQVTVVVTLLFALQPIPILSVLLAAITLLAFYVLLVIDAIRLSKVPENKMLVQPILGYCILIVLLALNSRTVEPAIKYIINDHVAIFFQVAGSAMEPTLLVGDHVIVKAGNATGSNTKRGDIVVFTYDGQQRTTIRRVAALEGDVLHIKGNELYVNAEKYKLNLPLNTPLELTLEGKRITEGSPPVSINKNHLLVVGDNTGLFHENGFYGLVNTGDVQGELANIYWSWDKKAGIVRWSRIGHIIQ